MKFKNTLIKGRLLQRYKRFLADIELDNGEIVIAHCANPGAMTGLKDTGCRVWVDKVNNPKRKLQYDWHIIEEAKDNVLVGIHTSWPNKLVAEALDKGRILELRGYDSIRSEVKYGENSRIDFLLESEGKPPCYVEVKSITLSRTKGLAEFPDSPTARGTKHLGELQSMTEQGARAVILYIIQREDCDRFSIAKDIDPAYETARVKATNSGLESLAYACKISPTEIYITHPVKTVF
ncbi:MAG: DNA/RNA nuclease SfsA [Robiginitomaculum sp.]|nr:MAG: DNA/RNA nuclease SfsA [Robiginitomaculum sp.]